MLGRFQAPGVYTMPGPMTLLEGISMAGGPMTFAGTKEVSAGPLGEDLADLKTVGDAVAFIERAQN